MIYRKRPVAVQAYRIPDAEDDDKSFMWLHGEMFEWLRRHGAEFEVADDKGYDIKTLEGVMHASPGDFIIRGVQGEFYPCKPAIFHETYELVG